jgi:hypothetical protein
MGQLPSALRALAEIKTVNHRDPPLPKMTTHDEDRRSTEPTTPAQMATVRKLLSGLFKAWKPIDPAVPTASVSPVNLRHFKTKLSRLNLTEAAREAVALKTQFRREDEELCRQGRGAEVVADRMKNLGISGSGETRLLTVNGVRIKS